MYFWTRSRFAASVARQIAELTIAALEARNVTENATRTFLEHPDFRSHSPPADGEPGGAHVFRMDGDLVDFFFFVRDEEAVIEVCGIGDFDGVRIVAIYPNRFMVQTDHSRLIGPLTKQLLKEFQAGYDAIDGTLRTEMTSPR